MNIFVIILIVIAILMALVELLCMACMAVKSYNLRKYGYWWGNLPRWAENLVDRFSI